MTQLPSAAWKEVAVHFAGLFPSGDYIMVVADMNLAAFQKYK